MSNEILDVDLAGASPFVGQDCSGLINIVVSGFGVTKRRLNLKMFGLPVLGTTSQVRCFD